MVVPALPRQAVAALAAVQVVAEVVLEQLVAAAQAVEVAAPVLALHSSVVALR